MEETLTIVPEPRSSIWGRSAMVRRMGERKLMCMTRVMVSMFSAVT